MRVAAILALLLLLPAVAVANGANHGVVVRLTAGTAANIALTGSGDRLKLSLRTIDNPGRVPFGIIARRSDGSEIGRIAIFPPDRTGDYFLAITGPAPVGEVALSIDLLGDAAPLTVKLSAALE